MNKILFEPEENDQETTKRWWKDFIDTQYFHSLAELEQENSMFIVKVFSEYMSSYIGEAPEEWTPEAMEEVCTEIMPEKVSAELECFQSIAPVLHAFFLFLKDEGYQVRASLLADKVIKLKKTIVLNAANPRKWGMAKSFAMSTMIKGANTNHSYELKNLFAKRNAQKALAEFEQEQNNGSLVSDFRPSQRLTQQKKEKRKAQKAARKKGRGR